ncbi:hypothetical protein ANME2D_02739 [Candidatus Methanoperedens nitroreducens]|uniref:Uncharacterized protein n=1 Tax=Candidatus Methanoperedens nitratireducens TaxID=1392998 RepID=A0A062V5N3_9EURY|nr:hypothetical protein [Candidatus Methanoperedens nitroreducens]KCZ70715.1 hypothetical protein ANME2D_02739 [Candidatus Methanoperedens nitroreducens]MDJ1420569.1 hypothetical protein [Candidatus Methanoperedens sp.]
MVIAVVTAVRSLRSLTQISAFGGTSHTRQPLGERFFSIKKLKELMKSGSPAMISRGRKLIEKLTR